MLLTVASATLRLADGPDEVQALLLPRVPPQVQTKEASEADHVSS